MECEKPILQQTTPSSFYQHYPPSLPLYTKQQQHPSLLQQPIVPVYDRHMALCVPTMVPYNPQERNSQFGAYVTLPLNAPFHVQFVSCIPPNVLFTTTTPPSFGNSKHAPPVSVKELNPSFPTTPNQQAQLAMEPMCYVFQCPSFNNDKVAHGWWNSLFQNLHARDFDTFATLQDSGAMLADRVISHPAMNHHLRPNARKKHQQRTMPSLPGIVPILHSTKQFRQHVIQASMAFGFYKFTQDYHTTEDLAAIEVQCSRAFCPQLICTHRVLCRSFISPVIGNIVASTLPSPLTGMPFALQTGCY